MYCLIFVGVCVLLAILHIAWLRNSVDITSMFKIIGDLTDNDQIP